MTDRTGAALVLSIQNGGLNMSEEQDEASDRKAKDSKRRKAAEIIFAYYSAILGHPRAIFTPARERLICARLQECNDDASALLYAIDGVKADDWVMGQAPQSSKRYDNPEFIFRNWGQVERFAETRPGYQQAKPHKLALKYSL